MAGGVSRGSLGDRDLYPVPATHAHQGRRRVGLAIRMFRAVLQECWPSKIGRLSLVQHTSSRVCMSGVEWVMIITLLKCVWNFHHEPRLRMRELPQVRLGI